MTLPELYIVTSNTNRRDAFTLIELLVVIGIIAFLAALTAVMFVGFGSSETGQRGADQMSGWLLIARQQARRDGVPTGIRIDVTGTQVQYVQQPDDVAQGVYLARVDLGTWVNRGHNIARIYSPNTNLANLAAFPVQAGDYFELSGGGVIRRLINFPGTKSPVRAEPSPKKNNVYWLCLAPSTVPSNPIPPLPKPTYNATDYTGVDLPADASPAPYANPLPLLPVPFAGPPSIPPQTNYRIIRQPQPIDGEAMLQFPPNVGIDFSSPPSGGVWGNTPPQALSNPPLRFDPNTGNPAYYEILFSPSGAVIGQNSTTALIGLFIRNMQSSNANDQFAGKPVLVTIQPRTGFIATHPVAPSTASASGDPYFFARDGKSSGL